MLSVVYRKVKFVVRTGVLVAEVESSIEVKESTKAPASSAKQYAWVQLCQAYNHVKRTSEVGWFVLLLTTCLLAVWMCIHHTHLAPDPQYLLTLATVATPNPG